MATEVVRVRRISDGAWYIGYVGSVATFQAVAKEDARICLSAASARALCSMPGFADCEVVVDQVAQRESA